MYGISTALAGTQGNYRPNNLSQLERNINDIANKQVRSKGNQTVTDNGTPIIGQGDDADKDLFMKILVAQMGNQDPMNPQDPTEYVSQLAQFATLEKMSAMNEKLDVLLALSNSTLINSALSMATSLIGKEVEVSGEEKEDENIVGVVKSTYIKDGEVHLELEVDGSDKTVDVKYEKLLKIGEVDENSGEENDSSEHESPEEA
ncbi:flagellar hook assembly protein FlgD [Clostridioides difficile]|uniref:flagellar hook assembly protein FlgD n=1 Tax=Clostridioides difficile TaxID=1496 RepID=UPI001C189C4A|nr:flagellar hook capping FlgD N-terminal domain-containing protein [Clostridioides difficile]MDF3817092.1 flagellar hook capping FlgD N-terminal domain-containing protein [Clostridioides difficile]HBF4284154.1 flagellar biosynthesis protein FlgD [Clostridioides difficile]HBF5048009.1 flagellar biosynthesis protein FlgD [Clostridioides difficile]HBF5113268.1 flagellar biosynthesis protein FlgD [Clostridioides difficile]HBF5877665.1 flagellar biosynthesis protein FlgD [Clostridioides difficile]